MQLSDIHRTTVGGRLLEVGIDCETVTGDLKRIGGNPTIVIRHEGKELVRGTWDEVRELIFCLESVTAIGEFG